MQRSGPSGVTWAGKVALKQWRNRRTVRIMASIPVALGGTAVSGSLRVGGGGGGGGCP